MKLKMTIKKIKCIDDLTIELPVDKGMYAITGQNGAGKSTVATCASSVFFNKKMSDYFGKTQPDAMIDFEYNGAKRTHFKANGEWKRNDEGFIDLKGFYEGSLIYGNRFRNTNYDNLGKLEKIDENLLKPAPEFVKDNFGHILHNNKNFYDRLFQVGAKTLRNVVNLKGDIFYYEINNKKVSQFHMSTGENLLISVLNSLNKRNSDRKSLSTPCIILLDEIELALHPSSLKRLVAFLNEISNEFNYAVYFSTHSIELIGSINPENIFFLDRHTDNSIEIINPCYPAYATRFLYDHSGYDYIILVEDDLAKELIKVLLRKYSLLGNKLVHVLPCGGYTNVISLAQEVVMSNLVGKTANIIVILDADIREEAKHFISKNGIANNIPLNYLPIESLEKYLKKFLFDEVDHKLFRKLNDFVFHQISLKQIIQDYKNSSEALQDNNGKKLYTKIDNELRARNKSRNDIIEIVVDYLIANSESAIGKIVHFLKKQLNVNV